MTSDAAVMTEPQYEDRLLAKIRRRLIPFMFLLYIVSYLDRVNVGFAALQMNRDLGLSASVFGLGSGIFFIGYFLFEVPSNLIMERIGARLWIARIMVTWGLVSAGMMFMKGPASFYTLRFLLGLAEAGFFPGMILYLTYWFPRRDHARAVALFMTANAIAGVVGGPISGALLTMHGLGGLAGWQWLFLLEGLPAVVLGFVTLAYLPNGPQDAAWLGDRERQWLKERLAADRTTDPHTAGHNLAIRQILSDRRVWVFCALYFLIVLGLYSISFWLPQILKGLSGSSDFLVGVFSALPYIVATIGMVWIGRHSDRHGERRWHVAGPALLAALGFVLSTQMNVPALALVSISLAALGIWGSLGPFWAMSTSVLSGSAAAAGIAWINSVGNLAGFVGPYVVGLLRDATGGFGTAMAALALFLVLAAIIAVRQPRAMQTVTTLIVAVGVAWTSRAVPAQTPSRGTGTGEWPAYHGDSRNHHYSPLAEIDAGNFNRLEVAWRLKTDSLGNRPAYKLERTPLMVGGVVYTTAGTRRAVSGANYSGEYIAFSLL